jgi:hypothetical protein
MSFGGRVSVLVALFIVAVGFVLWGVFGFLLAGSVPTVDFTSAQPAGAPVDLTVQTVGAIGNGFGDHPTWVSYLVKDPQGQWIHSTIWKVPAHTRINLTVEQYDSGSPLRNQQWGLVQGTIGGVATYNGKVFRAYNSNTGNGVGHTFAIPTLGINIPLIGVSPNATNVCGQAPCSAPSSAQNIIKASFVTPGPGEYPWQCFVPCGLGFLFGNGGPMSTVGYMGGFLDVVS